ncbi:MAG: response regulator [Bacilli bacterium]|nr:response regulator [Bacilli bacterium]
MKFGTIFTLGSLFYLILLLMIFLKKKRISYTQGTIYKYLLVFSMVACLFELVGFFLIERVASLALERFIRRTAVVSILMFIYLLFIYTVVVAKKISFNSFKDFFKNNKLLVGVSFVFFAVFIVYYFLPYIPLDLNNIIFLQGDIILVTLIPFTAIMISFMVYFGLKARKTLTRQELFAYFGISIIFAVMVTLQFIFNNVSFLPMGSVLMCYLIYFCIENPDIKIINELESSKTEIDKSNRTKTDFLSNMTYEVKGPMNIISSISDALLNLPKFDLVSARSDIQQIQTASNNLIDIVNNILDISKIESGEDQVQNKDYSINTLINELTVVGNKKIGAKPVKLLVNVDNNISSVVSGDYGKLYQVLLNVLSNAIKFTDVGKITLSVNSTKNNGFEDIVFKINDTGVGIKEEDTNKIFNKFGKTDNVADVDGSGLGLAITKKYIELLGGKIWFESQYRVGSTFYVSISQKIVDQKPLGEVLKTEKPASTMEKLDCSAYTALIVDDNLLNIKVAKRLLEGYKFKVESVTSGQECVYKIKEDAKYDIIFMDHMMPEMDGIETLHVLKKLDGYELPPIVALTANAIAGMKEMYLNEGFDEYLSKPINTTELNRIINLYFNK